MTIVYGSAPKNDNGLRRWNTSKLPKKFSTAEETERKTLFAMEKYGDQSSMEGINGVQPTGKAAAVQKYTVLTVQAKCWVLVRQRKR